MMDCQPSRRGFMAGLNAFAATAAIGCSPTPVKAQGGMIFASQFKDLSSAFASWGEAGGTLVIDGDYNLLRPVTVTFLNGLAYHLTTDRACEIRYSGPRFHWAICLLSQGGNPLLIDGQLSIDGGNLVSMPLFARFENVLGNARRDCSVSGLAVSRARMVADRSPIDGSRTNAYGATGMMFMGGFDHLVLRNVAVSGVTRSAGAGSRGSQGCAGIAAVALLGTTASARYISVTNFSVRNIDSDDSWTSEARGDMDGVLIFQTAESGASAPLVQDGHIVDAAGRGVKVFAPTGGGRTERLRIERSIPGPVGGAVDVAHQHGDGIIRDISVIYTGAAHANPSTVIAMNSNEPRPQGFPIKEGVVSGVTIHDTTGLPKLAIINVYQSNPADHDVRAFDFRDITDDGTSEFLLYPAALGDYGSARIALTGVHVKLLSALLATADRNRNLEISIADSTLAARGDVPVKTTYDKRPVPPGMRITIRRAGRVTGLAQ